MITIVVVVSRISPMKMNNVGGGWKCIRHQTPECSYDAEERSKIRAACEARDFSSQQQQKQRRRQHHGLSQGGWNLISIYMAACGTT